MSLTVKTTSMFAFGIFAGASLWLWQMMGEDVFVSRVFAMAQSCL